MEIEVDLNNKETKKNRKIMLEVIKQWGEALIHASKNLRMDPSFNLEAIRVNAQAFQFVYNKMKLNDKSIILEGVRGSGLGFYPSLYDFAEINVKLRDDYNFISKCLDVCEAKYLNYAGLTGVRKVRNVVSYGHGFFKYVSKRLRANKKLALRAIKYGGATISDTINLSNDEKILIAYAKTGFIFKKGEIDESLSKKFTENKKYIKHFVTNRNAIENQWDLKKIRSKFLNDKELAKLAIQKNSQSFEQFNKKFTKDREMILDAVKKHKFTMPVSMMFADKVLKRDKKFVEKCIDIDGNSILWVDKKFANDRKLVLKAIDKGLDNFDYLPFKKYSKDEEFVNKSIKVNLSFYKYMDNKFKLNEKITRAAVKENYENCKYIPKKFKSDRSFVLYAVSQNFEVIKYMDKKFKYDEKLILAIIKNLSDKDPYSVMGGPDFFWKHVDKKLERKTDFIVSAIKINDLYRSLFGEYDYNPLEDPVVSKVWGEIDDKVWHKNLKFKINFKK